MSSAKHTHTAGIFLFSAAFLAGVVLLWGCSDPPAASGEVVTVTDATFDEVTGHGVVLVDFWAAWCRPCLQQGPIVEKIAKQYGGRVVVAKLDVDKNPKSARGQQVRNIPTLIVFKDGKVYRPLVGLQSEAQLTSVLDAALK